MRSVQVDTAIALAKATAATAVLDDRMARSPVRDLVRSRSRVMQAEALAWVEGDLVDADDMALRYGPLRRGLHRWPMQFTRVFGKEWPAGRPPSVDALMEWLGITHGASEGAITVVCGPSGEGWLTQRPVEDIVERLETWQRRVAHATSLPRLLAGAEVALAWRDVAPLARGNLVVGMVAGDRWSFPRSALSAGGLVAIGMRASHVRWANVRAGGADIDDAEEEDHAEDGVWSGVDDDEGRTGVAFGSPMRGTDRAWRLWLSAISSAARELSDLEGRLGHYARRVDDACGNQRADSRLREALLLAAANPAVTTRLIVDRLKVSKQTAHALVAKGEAAHLLRETTNGASYRRWRAVF